MKPPGRRWTTAFWVSAAVLGLAFCVFAPVLTADRVFAFRDAAHFYPPLWRMIVGEWSAGRVPLWNPYENLGQPLLAHPAAAVCYPGQLVFLLPLSFRHAYTLYLVGHVLLAAATAYWLARAFRASPLAAGTCSLAYAFSGNVLMQHTNAPFLVGAAWLPLAVLGTDRIVRRAAASHRSSGEARGNVSPIWPITGLGIPLALMVLGGDPQMAYNVGLLAGLYVLITLVRCRRRRTNGATANAPNGKMFRRWSLPCLPWAVAGRAILLLVGSAVLALVLSAVQVLPSAQLTAQSNRVPPSWGDRLCGRLEPQSHHEHAYHFSVGPWRLAEFFWPNVSGRQYPVHRRWLSAIPAEGRVWTPTLYMGAFPIVLALAAMRLRHGPIRRRWLAWAAILSTVAGFGYYGLGWLLAECHVNTQFGGPFGGLYWLMNLLLPGYLRFRYPPKLLVVTSLAISLLAARGWDRVFHGQGDSVRRLLFALGGVSLLGLIGVFAVGPFWNGWLAAVPADQFFGPLDARGAWRDLATAFAQTAILCGTFAWLLRAYGTSVRGRAGGLALAVAPVAALMLVAADLGWSNAWLVATVPGETAMSESGFGQIIATPGAMAASNGPSPARVWRHPIWMPPAWRKSAAVDRLDEAMRFDRDTLWPNYNLDMRIAVAEVHGTMMVGDYADFLARHRLTAGDGDVAVLDLLSHAVRPPGKTMPPGWRPIDRAPDAVLWYNSRILPRAWIAASDSTGRPRDIEGESCHVMHFDPQRVELEAALVEPGLVVLAEQFYPGWRLEVSRAGQGSRLAPIERANRVMRAARLPAGRYRLTFLFRPWIACVGAAISVVGWLTLAGCAAWSFIRR